MNSTTTSTSSSSLNDQTPLYARRAYPSSPSSSFGQAQGRCATAAPTLAHNSSERFRSSPFGYSTPTMESPVAPLTTQRSPPPPPAFPQMRSDSRQGTHEIRSLPLNKGNKGRKLPWKPGATTNETTCHTLIDSKSGGVDIKLHVGGLGEERADKALIDVRSKTGKVKVKPIEMSGGRRVHLDVVNGKGTSR